MQENNTEYPVFPDPPDEIHFREHFLRYEFSLPHVEGMRVLDIGCGARRGPFLMAQKARLVIGTDVSQKAVREAAKDWKAPQLIYAVMDAGRPCFQAGAFDVITCFEVIEHLSTPSSFLSEITKVLTPDGLLIISTPNKMRVKDRKESNPHHVREFSAEELESILSAFFAKLEFFSLMRTQRAEALLDARRKSYRLTRLDPLGFRRFIPSTLKKWFYDRLTLLFARSEAKGTVHLDSSDLRIVSEVQPTASYFIGLCQRGNV